MSLKIDLNVPVVGVDVPAVMVRPGRDYWLMDQFVEKAAIAPDLPLLSSVKSGSQVEQRRLDLELKRANEFRSWIKKPIRDNVLPPSRDLESYALVEKGGHHSRNRNTAKRILGRLKEGTLVFVPSKDPWGFALIGRLASANSPYVMLNKNFRKQELTFLGRRLINPQRIKMKFFPEELIDIRKGREAIIRIPKEFRDRIYREYYGNYVFDDRASFGFQAGDVELHATDVNTILSIALLIEDILITKDDFQAKERLRRVLLSAKQGHDLEVHARINSKFGRLVVQGVSATPLLLRILFGMALCGSLPGDAQQIIDDQVLIENKCAENTGVETVKPLLVDFFKELGVEHSCEVLDVLKIVAERNKVPTSVTVIRE